MSTLSCPGEHGLVANHLSQRQTKPTPDIFYNGDRPAATTTATTTATSQQQQRERTSLLENHLDEQRDNFPPISDARVRPSALALSSTFSSPAEYYGDEEPLADVPRPMRHSAGINASSYRDYVYQQQQQQQQASRVPPTPPGHARPFTRSSSVPDQGHYYDAYFSDLDDGLGLGAPPLLSSSVVDSGRYKTSATSSSRFQDWRTGSYAISSTLRARGQRAAQTRLGRQFSVSSELPTTDPLSRSTYHYLSDSGLQHHQHSHHLLSGPGGPLVGGPAGLTNLPVRDHDVLLHSRSPPLTLGRSLQLVTENFGRYSSSAAADRRKKTVRFNSEEWGRQAAAAQAAAAAAAGYNPYLVGSASASLLSSGLTGSGVAGSHQRYLDSCLLLADDDDSWMSIEDVRSGRWARWDALRQESQDSQTRDSGIETGSCFTSSEDSNRGGDIYLSKKVD